MSYEERERPEVWVNLAQLGAAYEWAQRLAERGEEDAPDIRFTKPEGMHVFDGGVA